MTCSSYVCCDSSCVCSPHNLSPLWYVNYHRTITRFPSFSHHEDIFLHVQTSPKQTAPLPAQSSKIFGLRENATAMITRKGRILFAWCSIKIKTIKTHAFSWGFHFVLKGDWNSSAHTAVGCTDVRWLRFFPFPNRGQSVTRTYRVIHSFELRDVTQSFFSVFLLPLYILFTLQLPSMDLDLPFELQPTWKRPSPTSRGQLLDCVHGSYIATVSRHKKGQTRDCRLICSFPN